MIYLWNYEIYWMNHNGNDDARFFPRIQKNSIQMNMNTEINAKLQHTNRHIQRHPDTNTLTRKLSYKTMAVDAKYSLAGGSWLVFLRQNKNQKSFWFDAHSTRVHRWKYWHNIHYDTNTYIHHIHRERARSRDYTVNAQTYPPSCNLLNQCLSHLRDYLNEKELQN